MDSGADHQQRGPWKLAASPQRKYETISTYIFAEENIANVEGPRNDGGEQREWIYRSIIDSASAVFRVHGHVSDSFGFC